MKKQKRVFCQQQGWEDFEALINRRVSLGVTMTEFAGAYGAGPARISIVESGNIPINEEIRSRYLAALATCEKALSGGAK